MKIIRYALLCVAALGAAAMLSFPASASIALLSAVLAGCGGEEDPSANIPLGFLKKTYRFKRIGEEQAVYSVHRVSNGEGTTVIVVNSRHSPLTG